MSRLYKPGDTYTKTFSVSNSAGTAVNADSTPTCTIYQNGAADGAVTVTVTNPATGVYKATCTIPSGYAAGDDVELLVAATIGGIATKAFVDGVRLVAFNALDAVRLGLSALPNVAAGAAGGLPTATNSSGQETVASVVGAVGSVTAAVTVGTNNDKTGYALTAGEEAAIGTAVWAATTRTLTSAAPPTAAAIVTALWQDLTASGDFTTAGSIGLLLATLTAGRIGNLDHLNADVSSRATPAQILATPANLLATDVSGRTTLTPAEHTLVSGTDVPAGLTAQGYTAARAGYLDVLNGLVAAVWAAATRTLTAFGFSVAANNLPSDYQQRGVAVTLPAAPAGYGGPSAAAIYAAFQAEALTVKPAPATWDEEQTFTWALTAGKRAPHPTIANAVDVFSTDGTTKLFYITYTPSIAAPTGSTITRY